MDVACLSAGGPMNMIWLLCGVRTWSSESAIVEFSPIGLSGQTAHRIRQCVAANNIGGGRR